MKNVIKLEETGMFALSIYLFSRLAFAWWWYPALILMPDISMTGYIVNTRVGAVTYNFVHHKAVAIVVYLLGLYMNNEGLQLSGLILFGHSSMDRMLGYGLKYADGFQHTHLGMIGKKH
jgi:hypothetical protein